MKLYSHYTGLDLALAIAVVLTELSWQTRNVEGKLDYQTMPNMLVQ